MTIETLQNEMIVAMKQGNKFEKNVISGLIAQIKKAAIDAGCRDNITEEFVNKEILKAKKQAQESIDGAVAANRENLIEEYTHQYEVICSYAPKLIDNANEIYDILKNECADQVNKGAIMKWLKANYNGKVDMKVAAQAVGKLMKENQ